MPFKLQYEMWLNKCHTDVELVHKWDIKINTADKPCMLDVIDYSPRSNLYNSRYFHMRGNTRETLILKEGGTCGTDNESFTRCTNDDRWLRWRAPRYRGPDWYSYLFFKHRDSPAGHSPVLEIYKHEACCPVWLSSVEWRLQSHAQHLKPRIHDLTSMTTVVSTGKSICFLTGPRF